jgi:hypothetical protein
MNLEQATVVVEAFKNRLDTDQVTGFVIATVNTDGSCSTHLFGGQETLVTLIGALDIAKDIVKWGFKEQRGAATS